MAPEELQTNLAQFMGTELYWRWSYLFTRHVLTDGAKYLADHAKAYWLMDAIASHHTKMKVRKEPFQTWTLRKTRPGAKNMAVLIGTDGNGKILARQNIPYTDFPLDEIRLYCVYDDLSERHVIMLPSEY